MGCKFLGYYVGSRCGDFKTAFRISRAGLPPFNLRSDNTGYKSLKERENDGAWQHAEAALFLDLKKSGHAMTSYVAGAASV